MGKEVPIEELRKPLGIKELKDKIPITEDEMQAILNLRKMDRKG